MIKQIGKYITFTLAEVSEARQHWSKQAAFTLAEVLITLGIIGIVAAMTIPTLVKNYEKKVTETKLKKVYSTLNQIMLQSFSDNGPATYYLNSGEVLTGNTTKEFFDTYWLPYFKSPQVADNHYKTFYPTHNIYKSLNNQNAGMTFATMYDAGRIMFKDASGVIYTIFILTWENKYDENGNLISQIPKYATTQGLWVDLNGVKGPNIIGKDVFVFEANFNTNHVLPVGYNQDISKINSDCTKSGGGSYCATKIMKDGWQIKDDYPW